MNSFDVLFLLCACLQVEQADLLSGLVQPLGKDKTVSLGTVQSRCDIMASALYAGLVNSIGKLLYCPGQNVILFLWFHSSTLCVNLCSG